MLEGASSSSVGSFELFPLLDWALEPGDAVAFNMLTLHAAAGSRNRRRAFSVRLVGDYVRFAARKHPTSPPFPRSRASPAMAIRSNIASSRHSGHGRTRHQRAGLRR